MPMDYADILAYQALTQRASAAAQATYNQSMAANSGEDLAIKRAQNAFSNALQTAELSGYFGPGVGNGTVAGQPTLPNLQNTLSAFGSYVPGALAQLPGGTLTQSAIAQQQALSGQQLANQLAISQATGMYAQPIASQYSPGTVLTAPSTTPGLGPAYGVVNADGSVQMVTSQGLDQLAAQRGTSAQAMTQNAQPVDWNTLQRLSMGPPTTNATPTMAYQQQRYDQAERNAQLTGILNDPNSTVAAYNNRGEAINGQTFASLPQDQQQYWLGYNQNDPTKAAQQWAAGVNQALVSSGVQAPNQNASTLAMQALYGNYGVPQQGQQTLEAQGQYWEQAYKQAQANQTNTQAYLTLLSNLRGPADWAKYQQVLGSTPQGMRDLYSAAMGQYIPGGGATTGVQPQAADLNTMQQQIGGQGYGYGQGYGQMQQQPYTAQQYGGANGGQWQQATGGQAWGSGIGIGQQGMNADQAQQATGNGTNMWGGQQQQYNLPAPNQIAPQAWNNFTDSQKQLMLGQYEANGWDKNDVTNLFNQALPKYGSTNQSSGGTWSLR